MEKTKTNWIIAREWNFLNEQKDKNIPNLHF